MDCYFLVFVQLFEKYGTLVERNTALIEKVSPCRFMDDDQDGTISFEELKNVLDEQSPKYLFGAIGGNPSATNTNLRNFLATNRPDVGDGIGKSSEEYASAIFSAMDTVSGNPCKHVWSICR
eukprot:SAG31_NODE_1699_length_7499_cov_5.315135_10_plen_122_part_00